MKKNLLLPVMFIALLFSGCQPDDDVDMPKPEKSISEQILGEWIHTPFNRPYSFYDTFIEITYYEDDEDAENYDGHNKGQWNYYKVKEKDGKTFIEGEEPNEGYVIYEITEFTDSTMTWEMNDSLAALTEAYSWLEGPIHIVEKFKRK